MDYDTLFDTFATEKTENKTIDCCDDTDNYEDNAYVDASGDDYYNDSFEDYDYQDDQN